MSVQSYCFKTSNSYPLQAGFKRFLGLAGEAADLLLADLWSETWIDQLGTSRLKAYKVIGEKQVVLEKDGAPVYLPSRVRRGVAEQVGRVIRSQVERKRCFEDVREVVAVLGLEGTHETLVRRVAWTLQVFHGKYYRWALIRQTVRLLRKQYFNHGRDIWMVSYTSLVKPELTIMVFPYGVDDNQALKYRVTAKKIHYEVKLPRMDVPRSARDWSWHGETVRIPRKLQKKLAAAAPGKPARPDLRLVTLKGGLQLPVLQFAWDMVKTELDITYFNKKRALAVDLGLAHLTTPVIGQAGSQVTPPLFYSGPRGLFTRIEAIYKLIDKLQRKLKKYPDNWRGQTRREVEVTRLHAKLTRCRKQHVYLTVKELLGQASRFGCGVVVLENLSSYTPPKGKHALSRRLNNWMRGFIHGKLEHKAALLGIRVVTVPAYWTSSYCPRCGKKGKKVATTSSTTLYKAGRFFWCPHCQFRADRDYIGALNVYRVYLLPARKRYQLATAKPVFYTKTVLLPPSNRQDGIPVTS